MRNVNRLGFLIVLIGVVASFGISIVFGWSLSAVIYESLLFSALGFAAVLYEIIGANRTAHLWSRGRKFAAVACALSAVFAASISTTYELGFLSTMQEASAAHNIKGMERAEDLREERMRLKAQIKATQTPRPLKAIDADITAKKLEPLFSKSLSCNWARGKPQEDFCEGYGKLVSEQGAAAGVAATVARVEWIESQLDGIGASTADPRANYLAYMTGLPEKTIRVALTIALIAFMRVCTFVSPFVMWDSVHSEAKAERRTDEAQNAVLVRREPAPEPRIQLNRQAIQEAAAQVASEEQEEPRPCANGAAPFVADTRKTRALPPPRLEDFDLEQALDGLANTGQRPALDAVSDLPAEIPETDKRKRISDDVRKYISDCLIVDQNPESCERAMDIRAAYELWAENLGKKPFSAGEFGSAMTSAIEALGGSKRKAFGKGFHYFGCKFRPVVAHRLSSKDKANGKALEKNGHKLLGETSLGNDSMAMIEIRA
jgi:hypothetical protein